MDQEQIRQKIASFPRWHYQFDLAGNLTPIYREKWIIRHRERKRYFFEPVVDLFGGSLKGKRVLDLGCNAGFWSLNAAEAGADFVLGVDFPLTAVNVGSTSNLIVGFAGAVPVGSSRAATLATVRVLSFGDNRDGYLLATASPPSIPGMMAYVDAEDTGDDLVGMLPASGDFGRPVFWFGNWHVRESAQWGAVKSLYR